MDQAHEEAMKEKHEKRMKHMRQAGHDVHNLEANFEGNSVMIETGLGLRLGKGGGGGFVLNIASRSIKFSGEQCNFLNKEPGSPLFSELRGQKKHFTDKKSHIFNLFLY